MAGFDPPGSAGGVNVAVSRVGSYEERVCWRCFDGLFYDGERSAWVAGETCSGSELAVVYVYPKPKCCSQ